MEGAPTWEDTFDEVELESRPKSVLFSLPFLRNKIDPVAIFLILVSSVVLLFVAVKFQLFQLWVEFLQSTSFLRIATYPLVFSALIVFAGLIFQTFFWLRYKPMAVGAEERVDWPFVSVIMPAFNEEELISRSIDSIFSCNYPQEKIEVICVNDGSIDRTLDHMMSAKKKYGDKLKVISFEKNLGKRKAFYSGLKKSRAEIIISVDTDSKIGRSAIRNLVIPMIRDKRTGAVSGRVAVLNEKENFLTRMLSIRYSISFDFGRAYQSVYGSVFVCPGALTAYRRDLLFRFIREWVNQTFLDSVCTHGEDRALTTMILREGFLTRYQSNAIVYTKVPSEFGQMNRMYLRWTRSYVRESILFAKFMFQPYRKEHRVLPILDFFFLNILHPIHIFSLGIIVYSFVVNPVFIFRHLAFLTIASFFLSLYNLRTNKSFAFLYGIPYGLITAFLLWWMVPFAAVTMKNQSWLTR